MPFRSAEWAKTRRQIRALGPLEALCPFHLLCHTKRSNHPLLALATKQHGIFPKYKSSLNLEGFARAKLSSRLCHRGLYRSRRIKSQQTLCPGCALFRAVLPRQASRAHCPYDLGCQRGHSSPTSCSSHAHKRNGGFYLRSRKLTL